MELTIIWTCNFATLKCVLNFLSIFLLVNPEVLKYSLWFQ